MPHKAFPFQQGATILEVIVFTVAIVLALGGVILYLESAAKTGVSRAKAVHETYQPEPPRGWPNTTTTGTAGVAGPGGPFGAGGPLGSGGAYGPSGSAPNDTYPPPKTSPGEPPPTLPSSSSIVPIN